jgi:hypothetical protein
MDYVCSKDNGSFENGRIAFFVLQLPGIQIRNSIYYKKKLS